MKKKLLFLSSSLLLVGIVVLSSFIFRYVKAASTPVTGYAWSSNIGWIQMDHGVGSVIVDDSNGLLSGYAWSSNIGWIQFDPAGPYPALPNNSAKIDLATGVVTGWAKAISATGNGWDGWINMSGVSVNTSTGDFSGYAWGSDVMGWIDFTVGIPGVGVHVPPDIFTPSVATNVDIWADPAGPLPNTNTGTQIYWTSNNSTACSVIHNGLGMMTFTSGNRPTGPIAFPSTTYQLVCYPGDVTDSVTINVLAPASASYDLCITQSGKGTVTRDIPGTPSTPTCWSYDPNEDVELTATPANGRIFTGWGGDCAGTLRTSNCTVTMDAAKNVIVNFAIDPTYKEF